MDEGMTRREVLATTAGVGAAAAIGGCASSRKAQDGDGAKLRAENPDFPTPRTNPRTGRTFEDTRIDPATIVGQEGFYRAGKDMEGRWWLLHPDGQPFIYKGINAVCDGMPPQGDKPGNDYWQAWHREYTGSNADRRFCLDSFRIMNHLGFNAVGLWSYFRNPESGFREMG